jgi:hypothetical protein
MKKRPIGTIVHVEKVNWNNSPCRKPMKKRPIGTIVQAYGKRPIVHVESL